MSEVSEPFEPIATKTCIQSSSSDSPGGPVVTRVKLAGLRKTVLVIDGLFSPQECAGLLAESYQPCHGGYVKTARRGADGCPSSCCSAGASSLVTEFDTAVGSTLWSRLAPHLPKRYVPEQGSWKIGPASTPPPRVAPYPFKRRS